MHTRLAELRSQPLAGIIAVELGTYPSALLTLDYYSEDAAPAT